MKNITLCWLVAFAVTSLREVTGSEPDNASQVLAEFSIEKDGGPVLVPLQVEWRHAPSAPADPAKPYYFLLDTGAASTCYDESHRAMLGKAVSKFHTGTSTEPNTIEAFDAPGLRIGGINVRSHVITCIDLRWLSDLIGQKIDGVLGMDVLDDFAFSIDFDEGWLRFHREIGPDFGRPVALVWKGDPGVERPFVKGALNARPEIDFQIDTGGIANVSVILEYDRYEHFLNRGILTSVVPQKLARLGWIATRTGKVASSCATVERFALGGYTHGGLLVMRHPRANIVGLAYLSRFFVAFDFRNGVMYLRPGKGFHRSDTCYDFTSFVVSRDGSQVLVSDVRQDGWGAMSGIQAGDALVAINGRGTKDLSTIAIRRMLAIEQHQELDIRRNGKEQRIVLDLTSKIERLSGRDTASATQEIGSGGSNGIRQ